MASLGELLYAQLAPDGKPLFRHAQDLGQAIADLEIESNRFRGLGHSAGVALTAALRPSSRARINDDLRDLILAAARKRLSPFPERVAGWIAAIETAALEYASLRTRADSQVGARNEMLARARQAGEIVVVQPVLDRTLPIVARPLREILIEQLGLRSDEASEDRWNGGEMPHFQSTFVVNDEGFGRLAWRQLFDEIVTPNEEGHGLRPETAAERLKLLSSERRLRIVVAPPALCACPIVVLEPGAWEESTAFCAYADGDNLTVHRVPMSYLNFWRVEVYDRIGRREPEYSREIRWDTESAADLVRMAERRASRSRLLLEP